MGGAGGLGEGCEYGLSSPSIAITTRGTKGCSSPPQTSTEATVQEGAPGEKGGAGEDEEVLASPVNSHQSLKTVGPLEKVTLWEASLLNPELLASISPSLNCLLSPPTASHSASQPPTALDAKTQPPTAHQSFPQWPETAHSKN